MSRNTEIADAAEHMDRALEHHEAGRHSSVKRRIELARGCLERALGGVDPLANPSAAEGAQTSSGQQPRSAAQEMARRLFSPERRR